MGSISQIQQQHNVVKIKFSGFINFWRFLFKDFLKLLHTVERIGVTPDMNAYEKSKLGIFNHLNFFQFITGIIAPLVSLYGASKFPAGGWLLVCLPALVSVVVLILNLYYKHQWALLSYFLFYPLFICFNYINGINLGIELSFVLYGILSVFFIQDIGYMIFSIIFSMVSYFVLSVLWKIYPYQLEDTNYFAFLVNKALIITYIFYGLYLIKKENDNYNTALQKTNSEIKYQASQLHIQARELEQLNSLKNKLFSVISHDLKAPMYALRNVFDNIHSQDLPANEVKAIIPDIKKELNYTIGLMENLLQWTKTQMQAHITRPQVMNAKKVIQEVMQLLHLQAEIKGIRFENNATVDIHAYADRDMIHLILRNLMSNAIKFSNPRGTITVGAREQDIYTEVYVQDSGNGISSDDMEKINRQDFFSTNGTAQEQGTGLGLMLCKEFLAKNGGRMKIETELGKGSIFSFTLPKG